MGAHLPPSSHGAAGDTPTTTAVPTAGDLGGGGTGGQSQEGLQAGLKNRHLSMIAIGGVIGAGLFVGSGPASRPPVPASCSPTR